MCEIAPWQTQNSYTGSKWNFTQLFIFWLHCVACGILVSQSGIKPVPPALEVHSLDHQASPWNLILDLQGDGTWYIRMSTIHPLKPYYRGDLWDKESINIPNYTPNKCRCQDLKPCLLPKPMILLHYGYSMHFQSTLSSKWGHQHFPWRDSIRSFYHLYS